MGARNTDGPRRTERSTITGRMAPCPNCETATGVPLPRESTIVESADEADGTSITECPLCDTEFEVHYTR